MKAISLWQPWASLVVLGHKRIETRSRNNSHRGPVLIHASKNASAWKRAITDDVNLREAWNGLDMRTGIDKLPFGAIIGMVNLRNTKTTDEIWAMKYNGRMPAGWLNELGEPQTYELTRQEAAFGNYNAGRYGYLLSDPVVFAEPIPAKGMLGLWQPDAATMELVNQAIAATSK